MRFSHRNWTLTDHLPKQPKTRNDYEDVSRKKYQILLHRANGFLFFFKKQLNVAVNRESEASQIWRPAG